MAITALDILRSANILIRSHGEDAEIECAAKCDEHLAAGDMDRYRLWVAILKGIKELRRTERRMDETLN